MTEVMVDCSGLAFMSVVAEGPVSHFSDFVVAEMCIIWITELVFRGFSAGLLLARLVRSTGVWRFQCE